MSLAQPGQDPMNKPNPRKLDVLLMAATLPLAGNLTSVAQTPPSTQRFTTGGLRETIMFIAGPDIVQNTADERLRTAELERLVFTEIDHNYVNPGTDRHQQRVKDVFRNVGFWNADVNYRSAVATFNEYMTWAVFNVYARDTYDSATAAAFRESVIRSMVQQRKFLKFREFEQIVMEVSAASGPQPCIPNLYGEILDRAAAIR